MNDVFVSVPDPRSARQARHSLSELLTVAVCAVPCGADDFVDIALWGRSKVDWLRGFLRLEADMPSHDTFGRVFGLLDAQAFEAAFLRWVGAVVPALNQPHHRHGAVVQNSSWGWLERPLRVAASFNHRTNGPPGSGRPGPNRYNTPPSS